MKNMLIILFYTLILFPHVYSQNQEKIPYKAYRYMQQYPLFNEQGEIKGYKVDTIEQYLFDSIVLFKTWEKITQRLNGNIAFEELVNKYFLYHLDSSNGVLYNFHSPQIRKKVVVDSFLVNTWMNQFELSTLVDTTAISFIKQEANTEKKVKNLFFAVRMPKETTTKVDLEITVNELSNDFKGSLSRIWDKKYGGKVSRVKLNFSNRRSNMTKSPISYFITYSVQEFKIYSPKLLAVLDDYLRMIYKSNRAIISLTN